MRKIERGHAEYEGSLFFVNEAGNAAIEAMCTTECYIDEDGDVFGKRIEYLCVVHDAQAVVWKRYERNPNTGKSWWVKIDSGYCDTLDESWIGAGAVALAEQLAKGKLPEQLPEGWHEVPELDFGRDGRTCAEEALYNDLQIASMFRAA